MIMKGFLACFLIVVVSALDLTEQEAECQAYKLEFGKVYKTKAEEIRRCKILFDNLRTIEEHNILYELGLVSYKQGINQFTDMTIEEFRATLTLRVGSRPHYNVTKHLRTGLPIPDSVDWRTKGQVTEVKDQGDCGSCWAFSMTGSTEAAYFRNSGQLISLSEQQLVDCTRDINGGCKGGDMTKTFPYIGKYGLQSEESYPYISIDSDCKYNAANIVTKISSFKSTAEDEDALLDAVANVGPVSVTMDASNLFLYTHGIFEDKLCSPRELNHGVLIVGYGSENGKDFWIVKNSWGLSFGEQGYFRILRGHNQCGIAEEAVYPIV